MSNTFKKFGVFTLILLFSFSCTGCSGRTISTACRFAVNKIKNLVSAENAQKFAMDIGTGVAIDMVVNEITPIHHSNENSNSTSPSHEGRDNSSTSSSGRETTAAAVGATVVAVAANTENNSSQPQGDRWIKDNSNDIYMQNPSPSKGESISWSGGYVQDGEYKFANGSGTTVWRNSAGKVVQVDEGTFERGQRQGRFKHQFFPNGNVEYSNWNNGEEIADDSLKGVHYAGTYRSGLKAYMLLDTLSLSDDKKSFDIKLKAAGDETVYLDYHIWKDGTKVKFFNSQGFSGEVTPSTTPIEYEMWNFVQKNLGGK